MVKIKILRKLAKESGYSQVGIAQQLSLESVCSIVKDHYVEIQRGTVHIEIEENGEE